MAKYVIIVAGGSGSRFGGNVPKQFLPLGNLTVLMVTINKFVAEGGGIRIIVVLPSSQVDEWHRLCDRYGYRVPHEVVAGGESRFQSVKNALGAIAPAAGDLIAVHDGVRPLVSSKVIQDSYATAASCGTAVPAVAVTDSVRSVAGDGSSVSIARSSLRAVQTPQTFDALLLKKAYDVPFSSDFTDDASVVEHSGKSIRLIDGDAKNIKITHSIDLLMAQELLKNG